MGLKNFAILLVGVPAFYTCGLITVLFEHRQGYMDRVVTTLTNTFGIAENRFPVAVLLCSVILWYLSFFVSLYSAALARDKEWDNRTPRNMKERKEGLSFRANSAHENESEQFPILFAGISLSFYFECDIKWVNFCCASWIVHRTLYHFAYYLNIDFIRSLLYCGSFVVSILLLLSCMYSVETIETRMNAMESILFDGLMKYFA